VGAVIRTHGFDTKDKHGIFLSPLPRRNMTSRRRAILPTGRRAGARRRRASAPGPQPVAPFRSRCPTGLGIEPAPVTSNTWAAHRRLPDCHDVDKVGFTFPGAAVCGRCHTKESAQSHTGGATKTDCLSCHTFAPNAAAPTCIDCHRETQGKLASLVQHSTTACGNCHHPHETPSVKPAACENCHDERATAHAAHSGSNNCLDCHRAHAPAETALQICSTCHEKPAGPKPAGHDSCLGCHNPHDFVAAGAKVCVGCHGSKPTGSAVVPTLPRYELPYAARPAERRVCRRCHGEVTAVPWAKKRIDCHVPHSGDRRPKQPRVRRQAIAAPDNGAHAGSQPATARHAPHSSRRRPAASFA
jgi:hypothetical protein